MTDHKELIAEARSLYEMTEPGWNRNLLGGLADALEAAHPRQIAPRALGRVIWAASQADEGTVSVEGADIVAGAVIAHLFANDGKNPSFNHSPVEGEVEWRKAIADQVRRNCTPSSEAYTKGGDVLIYAVADWIENPPERSHFALSVEGEVEYEYGLRKPLDVMPRMTGTESLMIGYQKIHGGSIYKRTAPGHWEEVTP